MDLWKQMEVQVVSTMPWPVLMFHEGACHSNPKGLRLVLHRDLPAEYLLLD
jgi:hypothetical protein